MKTKLFVLTRMLVKSGSSASTQKKTKFFGLKINRSHLMGIVMFFALLPLLINIISLISYLYDVMVQIDQEGMILSLGILSVSFIVFFFGVFYCVNVFYFAYDIERLIVLPVKPWEIVLSKYFTVLLYEYITAAFVMLPVMGVYAYKSKPSLSFYLYSPILFILIPVIPLILSGILVMVSMRFTGLGKNKDRFKMIGGIAALVLALGFNFGLQRIASISMTVEQMQDLLIRGNNSLMGVFGKFFPGTGYAARTLSHSAQWEGLGNFVVFLLLCFLFLLIFIFLSGKLYFKGVIGISESGVSRAPKANLVEKESRGSSAIISYTLKEIRILLRTPIYFINCVLTNFLWPILLIVLPAIQSAGQEEGIFPLLKNLTLNPSYSFIIAAAFFGASLFISGSNAITSTAISREGSQLYINKYIPIKFSIIIKGKVLAGVFFSSLGMLTMFAVFSIYLKLSFILIFFSMVISVFGIFISSLVGILIDLYNPKLVWDNEQKAVKQNINVLTNMLISAALAAAAIFAAIKLNFSLNTGFLVYFVFAVAISYLLYRLLLKIGPKLLLKME